MNGIQFSCDILGKLPDDVPGRVILADVVLSYAMISRKDAIASRNGTAELLSALPDDLRPVRISGVAGVVLRSFAIPAVDSIGSSVVTGSRGEVLSVGTEFSSRVLENALVRPRLCCAHESGVPRERLGIVLGPLGIVNGEIGLFGAALGNGRSLACLRASQGGRDAKESGEGDKRYEVFLTS